MFWSFPNNKDVQWNSVCEKPSFRIAGGVPWWAKDLRLSQQQFRWLPWCGFNPWCRDLCMPWALPKKKNCSTKKIDNIEITPSNFPRLQSPNLSPPPQVEVWVRVPGRIREQRCQHFKDRVSSLGARNGEVCTFLGGPDPLLGGGRVLLGLTRASPSSTSLIEAGTAPGTGAGLTACTRFRSASTVSGKVTHPHFRKQR